MFIPFRLKKPIGESYTVDLEDSINTKRALGQLGKLAVPDDDLDAYPTRPMFDAIKSFQRDQGLAIDGIMKPDGPTHRRLNEILEGQEKPFPAPPKDGVAHPLPTSTQANPATPVQPVSLTRPLRSSTSVDLGDVDRVKSALHVLGLPPSRGGDDPYPSTDLFNNIRAFQRREGLREDGEMLPGGETEKRLNEVIREALPPASIDVARDKAANPQVAMIRTRPGQIGPGLDHLFPLEGGGGGGGGAAWGAVSAAAIASAFQTFLDQLRQQEEDGEEETPSPLSGKPAMRTDISEPLPTPPGLEPPDDELPDRTESPSATVELPDLSSPLLDREKPTIFVLPAPDPGEFGTGIVENKGNETTRKELERIRDYFRRIGWRHIAGGRYAPGDPEVLAGYAKPGEERKEQHIPGHFGSLKGGHFSDLTFEDERGRILHVQSVDVDRNGKPTQRELRNAERIRQAGYWDGQGNRREVHVILVPKGFQLDRQNRPVGYR